MIAPKVGGAKASDGSWIEADQMIDGGPSVLYDAVALLPSQDGMADLVQESTARDFVADAFAHCKFIGYVEAAMPLLEKAGIAEAHIDEGFIALAGAKDVSGFIEKLGQLAGLGPRAEGEAALAATAEESKEGLPQPPPPSDILVTKNKRFGMRSAWARDVRLSQTRYPRCALPDAPSSRPYSLPQPLQSQRPLPSPRPRQPRPRENP